MIQTSHTYDDWFFTLDPQYRFLKAFTGTAELSRLRVCTGLFLEI